jgi:hypothetical protein
MSVAMLMALARPRSERDGDRPGTEGRRRKCVALPQWIKQRVAEFDW